MNKTNNKLNKQTGELVYIEIGELFPHPDNPRKDLGDLTELAESIKTKGIMQNLTVVKGHTLLEDEYESLCKQYNENPTEELRDKINNRKSENGYTVIIGHRRLGASKLAGLKELPCVIVDMEMHDQIATMLLENMQRSDLTIYEQAQGFQMMLDLGETQTSIAEQTGFSKTTVSRRLKLLSLDKKKFHDAEERGGTLEDYIKVAEIKNEKSRNMVTDAIGTSNFNWKLRDALEKQELQEKMPVIKKEMKTIGAKRDDKIYSYDGKYEVVESIEVSKFEEGCIRKKSKKETQYWWNVNYNKVHLYILKPKQKKAPVKKTKKELQVIELNKKLKFITEKAYECRKEFLNNFNSSKKYADIISEWLWEIIYNHLSGNRMSVNFELLCEKLGEKNEKYKYSCERENLEKYIKDNPSNAAVVVLAAVSGDGKNESYFYDGYNVIAPIYKENEDLDFIYKYLCKLGYEMSDEEKALQNGTHELFK